MPDLNLDELLGPEYVRHYLRFIAGAGHQFYVAPDPVDPSQWASFPIRDNLVMISPGDDLVREGYGPDVCSSDTRLVLPPEICWDVCGYYRLLGTSWKATRSQLSSAYLRQAGIAQNSRNAERFTYALSQLLDTRLRREYDALPLGAIWHRDKYVQAALKEAAIKVASRASARGTSTTADEVLKEWGYAPPGAPGGAGTPEEPPKSLQRGSGAADQASWETLWSWYEQGDCRSFPRVLVAVWQALLLRVFAMRGIRARFAVGLTCQEEDFAILDVLSGPGRIILLGTRPPTLQLAFRAVDEWQASVTEPRRHNAQFREGR